MRSNRVSINQSMCDLVVLEGKDGSVDCEDLDADTCQSSMAAKYANIDENINSDQDIEPDQDPFP